MLVSLVWSELRALNYPASASINNLLVYLVVQMRNDHSTQTLKLPHFSFAVRVFLTLLKSESGVYRMPARCR